jgi:hypothetical protein
LLFEKAPLMGRFFSASGLAFAEGRLSEVINTFCASEQMQRRARMQSVAQAMRRTCTACHKKCSLMHDSMAD